MQPMSSFQLEIIIHNVHLVSNSEARKIHYFEEHLFVTLMTPLSRIQGNVVHRAAPSGKQCQSEF